MFCGKCGNKNEDAMKFCGKCGAPMGDGTPSVSPGVMAPPPSARPGCIEVGPIKLNAIDENNADVNAFGKLLKASFVFKIASVLLAIFFFMPFFSFDIRMFGVRAGQSMSGWTTAFGMGGVGSTTIAVFLLLIPIALFVLFQFKAQLEARFAFIKGRLFTLSSIGFVAGLLVLFLVRSRLNNLSVGNVSNSLGFWLSLLVYLVASAASIGYFLALRGTNFKIGTDGGKPSVANAANVVYADAAIAQGQDGVVYEQPVQRPPRVVKPFVALPLSMMIVPMVISVLLLVALFFNWIVLDIGGGVGNMIGDALGDLGDMFGGLFGDLGYVFDDALGDLGVDISGLAVPSLTISGWNTVFGSAEMGIETMGVSVGLFFIPLIQLVLFATQKTTKLNSTVLFVFSAILFVVGIALLGIFALQVDDMFFRGYSFGIGFFVAAALHLIGAVLSGVLFVQARRKEQQLVAHSVVVSD